MTQEEILELLKKKDDYFSGEEISRYFSISRQALWKHIQELRDTGYDIVAVPHLGYKLVSCPDRLFAAQVSSQLGTKILGRKIFYFDSIPSTMDVAVKLGLEGCPEGATVLAESQAKGRGRLGREWFSPKYKGIYLSLVLRPKMLPNACSVFTLLTAVACCEAIKAKIGIDVQIKWPNDLLVGNKKVGGILTELNAEMDRVNFIVIGIGLNVNNDKKSLVAGAVSLKEAKEAHIERIPLLQELLRKIEENYLLFQKEGPGLIIEKWKGYSATLGRRVNIFYQNRHSEADAVDIDSDGGLLIRRDSGLIEKVTAGDITHCR